MSVVLSEVLELLEGWFPAATAESWDAVGLVAGDPDRPVAKVMFAVDPTLEVATEAAEWGADLLVVHHPLFLKPVHGVARTTPKGRTLGVLTDAGCALLTAHTNADQASGGVSESLALALGLTDLAPLLPGPAPVRAPLDQIVVHVPATDAARIRDALAASGAGEIGDYDQASFTSAGEGRFRPLPGAHPAIGSVGSPEVVDEVRIEAVLPRARRAEVVAAVLATHPYEEPSYAVVELASTSTGTSAGTGRHGRVPQTTLAGFARTVAEALPATAGGVRVAGDPDRVVRTVALCGGAGDFLLDERTAGFDVYLTSDLRHHPASEFLERGGAALVDVSHWAAEWTWLPVVAARLQAALDTGPDDTVGIRVSTRCTDPWNLRLDARSTP